MLFTDYGRDQMARYHFRLANEDVLRKLLTADLDSFEEVLPRAEMLGRLLLLTEDEWYEPEFREIIVTDDNGFELLVLPLSKLKNNNSND